MGRKARTRAAAKQATKPGPAVRPSGETKTVKRLRKLLQAVNTLAQFEQMVDAHSRPTQFRRLAEEMLRPNLPCCASGYIHEKHGVNVRESNNPHADHCPTRKLVHEPKPQLVRPSGDVERFLGELHK